MSSPSCEERPCVSDSKTPFSSVSVPVLINPFKSNAVGIQMKPIEDFSTEKVFDEMTNDEISLEEEPLPASAGRGESASSALPGDDAKPSDERSFERQKEVAASLEDVVDEICRNLETSLSRDVGEDSGCERPQDCQEGPCAVNQREESSSENGEGLCNVDQKEMIVADDGGKMAVAEEECSREVIREVSSEDVNSLCAVNDQLMPIAEGAGDEMELVKAGGQSGGQNAETFTQMNDEEKGTGRNNEELCKVSEEENLECEGVKTPEDDLGGALVGTEGSSGENPGGTCEVDQKEMLVVEDKGVEESTEISTANAERPCKVNSAGLQENEQCGSKVIELCHKIKQEEIPIAEEKDQWSHVEMLVLEEGNVCKNVDGSLIVDADCSGQADKVEAKGIPMERDFVDNDEQIGGEAAGGYMPAAEVNQIRRYSDGNKQSSLCLESGIGMGSRFVEMAVMSNAKLDEGKNVKEAATYPPCTGNQTHEGFLGQELLQAVPQLEEKKMEKVENSSQWDNNEASCDKHSITIQGHSDTGDALVPSKEPHVHTDHDIAMETQRQEVGVPCMSDDDSHMVDPADNHLVFATLGDGNPMSPPSFMRPDADRVGAICISTSINCDLVSNDHLPFLSMSMPQTDVSYSPPQKKRLLEVRFPVLGTSPSLKGETDSGESPLLHCTPLHSTPSPSHVGATDFCSAELPSAIFEVNGDNDAETSGCRESTSFAFSSAIDGNHQESYIDQLVPSEEAEVAELKEADRQQAFGDANQDLDKKEGKACLSEKIQYNKDPPKDNPPADAKLTKCFDFPSPPISSRISVRLGRKRPRLRLGLSKRQKCHSLHNN